MEIEEAYGTSKRYRPGVPKVFSQCYLGHCGRLFLTRALSRASVKLSDEDRPDDDRLFQKMEVSTPKTTRRSTRLRVEIPVTLTSLDRRHPFAAQCIALVVGPQGAGLRASQALPLETPVLLSDLPSGGSASGRVANCLPLGNDGKYFLIGVSLYNHGNVWGIANPPADWECGANAASAGTESNATTTKTTWPYNLSSAPGEIRRRHK
jgi:hypothetical protein